MRSFCYNSQLFILLTYDEIVKLFLNIVRRITVLKELKPEVVRELIEKVVVHKTERINGKKTIKIDIYYNGLGKIDLPIEKA